MDTLSIDAGKYVESDLVDIGSLPLSALSSWRGTAIRAAVRAAVHDAGRVQVCDMDGCRDWIN
ncbi:MAG TPA: hypothetical protein VH333_18965 [Pseudonocardiaceae bacterium]|jgi:hypothetical protein|nr:hypothetical protein [Pseudonocardiaceae bacterium]